MKHAREDHAPQRVRVNGREADTVSVLERGLHYGDGLFETIACLDGRPRFLERHLRRLDAGCARIGLAAPDPAALAAEVREMARGVPRGIVKLIVSRGPAAARGYGLTGREQPTRIVLRYAWPPDDAAATRHGVRVRLGTLRLGENPALAGLKHCNRLEQVLARREWSDPDIAESVLFSSTGTLISGTMSNVFLVRDATLITPRVDRCGVAGIMREVVLDLARASSIAAEERVLDATDLASVREMFLTNALIGIRPVRELGGRKLAPGDMTGRLQGQLASLLTATADTAGEPHE